MIRLLREERGREKMEANNASHRRAEVSKTARAFRGSSPPPSSSSTSTSSLAAAEQHRDKLLGYQETSARRTRIIDEAADFETPSAGLSMWATPQERALQLKRQQKMLRKQEWDSKPAYEKRQMVLSIDLAGRKVVRRVDDVERPESEDDDNDDEAEGMNVRDAGRDLRAEGTFSRNPLLGNLIRPTYPIHESKDVATPESSPDRKRDTWRRVQDDLDDNEDVILDGGVYGDRPNGLGK